MRKSTLNLVKMMNRELVVKELQKNPNQSRADLAKKTKLSKPTISEIVRELIDENIVLETGYGPSTGGKKPISLVYNANFRYVIGILIENDTIFFALGDMNGEIIKIFHEKFKPLTQAEVILQLIVDGVGRLIKVEKIPMEKILGVVLGVSGITMDDNEIVQSSPTINWGTMNIKKELSRRLDKEVVIENDVNLMTIGEHYKGQAKNIKDFVYFFIGNGIGSGLFLDGSFYKGYHSASGEVGFMMIGEEDIIENDLGVFETNYGLFGISQRLSEKNHFNKIEDGSSLLLFLQKQRDNPKIKKILDEVIDNWAKATINMVSIIDPQAIILAGELEQMDQSSFKQYVKRIEKFVPKMPEIRVTKLGSKAGIYGAFHLGLEHFHMKGFKHVD